MKVQVLFFEGCPNHEPTLELVRGIVAALDVKADVEPIEVSRPEDAERLRFFGSPTVQINGLDIEPAVRSRTDYAYSYRMYGRSRTPSRELVEAAFREATTA